LLLLIVGLSRLTHSSSFLIRPKNGAYRWINMGFAELQPSELAKLAEILLLAWYLRLGSHYSKLAGLSVPFILTFVPLFLILIEPDLGTSILLIPVLFTMLFMAGAKMSHLGGIIICTIIVMFFPIPTHTQDMGEKELDSRKATAYWVSPSGDMIVSAAPLAVMEFHQLQRIDGWLRQNDPEIEKNKGYQLSRSKITLGCGQLSGRGDWDDADFYFRTLPEDHTDFIFSIIGGQWGFIGCTAVLTLYLVIIILGVEIAASTDEPFGRLLAIGVISLFVSQIVINTAMTMGLLPITGMTLPLISYGGSSLLVNCAAIGLLVNVAGRKPIMLSRKPFEHSDDYGVAPYRPLEFPPGP
ncbi:MAG TPA: FtsW/RodA/SpoVE family cell cycle protein, partial [Phycisphaerae bacterium]|nr:FtsW/RodA/SpoVE family cell cycle protein [Phycisphaerae bacterium]